ITYQDIWSPTSNEARCPTGYIEPADMTLEHMEKCKCGFWAYFSPKGTDMPNSYQSLAIVKGYGDTLIGPKGFRASKAEILGIVLYTGDTANERGLYTLVNAQIRENYSGIPTFDSLEDMLEIFQNVFKVKKPGEGFFDNKPLEKPEDKGGYSVG